MLKESFVSKEKKLMCWRDGALPVITRGVSWLAGIRSSIESLLRWETVWVGKGGACFLFPVCGFKRNIFGPRLNGLRSRVEVLKYGYSADVRAQK